MLKNIFSCILELLCLLVSVTLPAAVIGVIVGVFVFSGYATFEFLMSIF